MEQHPIMEQPVQTDLSSFAGKPERKYARLDGDVVVEILSSRVPPGLLYHHSLVWHDVTEVSGISAGWRLSGGTYVPPSPPVAGGEFSPLARITDAIDALRKDVDLLRSKLVVSAGHSSP